jgi:hypothetical protein
MWSGAQHTDAQVTVQDMLRLVQVACLQLRDHHSRARLVVERLINTGEFSFCSQCNHHYSTVHLSTVQYSTVQYSTVQYSTVQYSPEKYSTVQYSTVQCSTVQ